MPSFRLDFTEKGMADTERLRVLGGKSTHIDVFREALVIYGWFLITREAGKEILMCDPETGETEIVRSIPGVSYNSSEDTPSTPKVSPVVTRFDLIDDSDWL